MHVAGIIAGNEVGADHMSGVARGASIMAVQIFSRFDNPADCGTIPAPCVLSFTSSQLRALQFVQSKALNFNATGQGARIVAINMSLGGGGPIGAPCDVGQNAGYARRIQELRDDGVATFIAAGNEGYADGVDFPGCISGAVTVGAIGKKIIAPGATATPIAATDTLQMAPFSNRFEDHMVSLLSFGVGIRSSVPGPNPFKELDGTSMATPHATGAYAVLAAAFPNASVNDIVDTLKSTGIPVEEPFSKKHLPAVQLARAFAALKSKFAPAAAASAAVAPAATGAPAAASAAAASQTPPGSPPGGQRATRFIVDLPGGRAREAASAISQTMDAIAKSLSISGVKVAPIGSDTLTIVTDGEVDRSALQEALKGSLGPQGKVYVDKAVPTQR
jgi:subtilisin family serine protease